MLQHLKVSGHTYMESNLILAPNSSVFFGEGALLSMGCDITLGSGMELNVLDDATAEPVVLFDSVEALTLGDRKVTEGWYDAADVLGSLRTAGGSYIMGEALHDYRIGYWKGEVSVAHYSVPEPATATLSLLALAGIASRRRRK